MRSCFGSQHDRKDGTWLGCAVLCCAVLCCAVLCCAGLGWAGLGWAGLGCAGNKRHLTASFAATQTESGEAELAV